jgi:uncharacterized protein YodC (DUF2158 family)
MEFKIGDTVQLKSGGPIMTVVNVDKNLSGSQTVQCTWFTKDEVTKHETFLAASVRAANPA